MGSMETRRIGGNVDVSKLAPFRHAVFFYSYIIDFYRAGKSLKHCFHVQNPVFMVRAGQY